MTSNSDRFFMMGTYIQNPLYWLFWNMELIAISPYRTDRPTEQVIPPVLHLCTW